MLIETAWEDALVNNGWASGKSMLPPAFWSSLSRLQQATQLESLMPAGTGKGSSFQAQGLRGDRIHWLTEGPEEETAVLAHLHALRADLKERLRLPLNDLEAHLALYAPGTGYTRHVDAFKHDNRRLVSLVCYLNPSWKPEHGGCLRLHLDDGPVDVAPDFGNAALFLSERIEHEVLASAAPRWSLACWFRR